VDLLATWIHKHRQWLRECTSGVLLVQIRDHLENGWRTKVGLKSEPSRWARAMAGLTSTLEAVLKARNASMSFRNDELLGMLQQELNGGDACFFSTVAFELSEPAPLSWELSSEDTALMDGSTHSPEFQARLSAVKSWLKASPAELEHARQTQECPGAGAALPTADRTPE
jgi:hypothetical protein